MRKAVVVKLLTARYISAAASIVLMFTLGWWWMGRTPTDKQSLQAVAAVELPTENDSPATPAYVQAGETFGNPLQSQVEKTNVIRYAEAGSLPE
ncbi:MAG: hypothetical protein IPM52_10350 [Bacteroidetes bacterium]|nr:hypothetical protein [Bacteroidota bacterium]